MADWVDIDNSTIEPDAPLISSTMFALRDNPQAIAEGAAGAPRIDILARQNLTAGDVARYLNPNIASSGTSAQFIKTVMENSIFQNGVIRLSCEHRRAGDRDASTIRFLKNGSVLQQWTTSSTSFILRELDVTVQMADILTIQHQVTGDSTGSQSEVKNRAMRTNGENIYPHPLNTNDYQFFLVS